MAPEFYDNLKYHASWSRLLFQFIFDRRYTLFSRIERGKRSDDFSQEPIVSEGVALSSGFINV